MRTKGLLIGMVMKSWLIYIVNASLVSSHIGYKLRSQLLDLAPILGVAIISYAVAYLFGRIIPCSMYVDAVVKLALFVALYVGIAKIMKMDALNQSLDMVRPFIDKFTKNYKKQR